MKKFLLLLLTAFSFIAGSGQIKISALPAMSGLCDTCKVPIVQSGVTKKAGGNQIAWGLKGTDGSTGGTHFIGTNDAQPFVIKTNGVERMRIQSTGNVGINTVAPNYPFEVAHTTGALIDSVRIDVSGSSGGSYTNLAIGTSVFSTTNTGTFNTAVGIQTQIISAGPHNTSLGSLALRYPGNHSNTAVGSNALRDLAGGGGYSNTVMGSFANQVMTTGNSNVSIGKFAMFSATNATANTVVGAEAGYSITTGTHNTGVGVAAFGQGSTGVGGTPGLTGTQNVGVGTQVLSFLSSGNQNVAIGYRSGYLITTGNYNVILGANQGSGIATTSNNIILSDGQGNIRFQNTGGIWTTDQNISMTAAGNKISIATGANASVGTATLSGGTIVVNTTAVTASSIIYVVHNTPSGTVGILSVPSASIVANTSFVINSSDAGDNSTVNWWIIN